MVTKGVIISLQNSPCTEVLSQTMSGLRINFHQEHMARLTINSVDKFKYLQKNNKDLRLKVKTVLKFPN